MPKPTDLPNWATDANYPVSDKPWSATVTKIEPTAGQQAAGFNPAVRPPAQYFNWWMNLVYLWLAWLNGLWDGSGNLTLDANASVTVSGTGKYKRGAKVDHVPAMAGLQVDGGTAMTRDVTHDYWFTTAASNVFRIPIRLAEGERLTNVKCRVTDAGTDVLTMTIWRSDLSGTNPTRTQLGTTANSTGSTGALETLDSGAIAETAGTQFYQYFAEFTCTFSAGCAISGIYVTTDVP